MATPTYDFNTGKLLSEGQVQSKFNTQTGQEIGIHSSVNTPSTIITPSSVNNTVKPFVVPTPTTQVAGNGLSGAIDSSLNVFKTQQEADLQARKDAQKTDKSTLDATLQEILGTNNEIANVGNTVDRTEQDTAKKLADTYTSQIEAEQLANRRAIENIQKNNPQGLFNVGAEQEINRLNRDSLSKQADLAILQNSAVRNYETASAIADRQVQLKLEPLKVKAENLKLFYEANKADFNKEDDRLYNEAIKKADNELKKEETLQNDIKNIKIEAAKNGASASVLNSLGNVKTLDEALKVSSNYLMSPKEKYEIEKLKGDIAKNTAELLAAKTSLGGTTGSPVTDIIAGSSRFGDKKLTDSQLEKIQKATNALGSMETLQGLLSQGKDGISVSGPVTGRKRTLLTQLGGDANAAAINATIQGLIPTVARGIFGEVGVLTDADINNYRKTVPNLNSTDAQNKLISLVMYDVLSRSLENTLVTNAQNQTNVSGFLSTYTDTKSRINNLKSNLGVVEVIPITPENKAKLEGAWTQNFSPENITNTLNKLTT
jgi:hypothetical protein